MIDLSFSAITGASKAGQRPKGEPYQRTRVRELNSVPLTAEQAVAMKATFDNALSTALALRELNDKLPNDLTTELARQQAERIYRLVDRAAEVGMRTAYAEAMGLSGDPAEDNRYLDDVSVITTFAWQVANFARRVLKVDDDEFLQLMAEQVPVEACPGTWLSQAVDLEIRRNEHDPNPNNAYDLEHLSYLPYVDLFFADKRIAAYGKQVLQRPDLPAACRSLRPPTRVARVIGAIEDSLIQGERST
jgi:hypothetical protein